MKFVVCSKMEGRGDMPAEIKVNTVAEHVGTEFVVQDEPSSGFALTLTSIVEHAKTEHQETFSLFFHGPSVPFLSQGIHKLKHDRLGEMEIFLVPIAKDKDGFQYEAVFNHVF
jgi:hypothetical protein